jgi:putative tryptophan/tyrosine transport system substrate-binding protein
MRRRDFIARLGGAAVSSLAFPTGAPAQQSAMPVIGFLDPRSPDVIANRLRAFRQGLKEAGYVDGENVVLSHSWTENQNSEPRRLVADFVRRKVAVIATAGDDVASIASAATKTIPIVFVVSRDPVGLGLVASLAQPGGNATGINFFGGELAAKRLELLRELVPTAARIAVIVNPAGPGAEITAKDVETAARAIGLQIQVLRASSSLEIDAAFSSFAREAPDALFVSSDPFLSSRRVQLVNLATRHGIPSTFPQRETTEMGALMSYASNIGDAWHQSGTYVGRILNGAKPGDLPVVQSTKFELVINHQTARMLGLTVPQSLLARADEVIE